MSVIVAKCAVTIEINLFPFGIKTVIWGKEQGGSEMKSEMTGAG